MSLPSLKCACQSAKPVQFNVASGNRLALLFRESWDPSWGVVLSVASGATDGVDESGLLELEWGGGS